MSPLADDEGEVEVGDELTSRLDGGDEDDEPLALPDGDDDEYVCFKHSKFWFNKRRASLLGCC